MKQSPFFKRLAGLLLAGTLVLSSSLPTMASGKPAPDDSSPQVQGSLSPVNADYLDYLANGRKGSIVPSTLDLSYLNTSYARSDRQRAMRRSTSVPAAFDLRDYGRAPAVEDQGNLGSCWTFAALGSAESGLIRQFPRISFSKLHLSWFTYTGNDEEECTVLYDTGDIFNNGGNAPLAVGNLAAWKGVVSAEVLPYNDTATQVDESLRYVSDYHLQDAFFLPNGSLDYGSSFTPSAAGTVKKILMDYGAVSVNYYALHDDTFYNEETSAYYCNERQSTNHAVLVVGWDDNFSRNNFNEACRPQNDGAWLLRNSWGTNWGDGGYFWISYEDKSIYFESYFGLESNDNYARNYQYDTSGWSLSLAVENDVIYNPNPSRTGYMSNIFTAAETEQLDAVSFYTTDAGTQYEISIYTGVEKDKPTSGRLALSGQRGTEPYAGYHTIELSQPVLLQKGQSFSVVVKLVNPQNPYAIPVETATVPKQQSAPLYAGKGGESYFSADGSDWSDVAGLAQSLGGDYNLFVTNVCIKAFTNPVSTVQFSLLEGPIALGSTLELSAPGADEIYYATGENPTPVLYTGPITIDEDMTVQAYAVTNGQKGAVRQRTYTQASSELVQLLLKENGTIKAVDLQNGDTAYAYYVDFASDSILLQPQGTGAITINGTPITSSDWSAPFALPSGQDTVITIRSEEAGKKPTEYTLHIYRSVLTYDYRAETVSFDESLYSLADSEGNIIHSGDVITPYIGQEGIDQATTLTLTELASMNTHDEFVPLRPVATVSAIDFVNECTALPYGTWNMYATKPDMSDAQLCTGDYIALTPGQNIYIQKYATDYTFKSLVAVLEVPSRPAAPAAPAVNYTDETITLPDTIVYLHVKTQEAAQGNGTPISVEPEDAYVLCYLPTASAFASDVLEWTVPARPAAPAAPALAERTTSSITLQTVAGAQYRLGDGNWQDTPLFTGLQSNTDYTFGIRLKATDSQFTSLEATAMLRTDKLRLGIPVKYTYNGKVVAESVFTAAEGVNTVTPDAAGTTAIGFTMKEGAAGQVTVNVVNQNGTPTADKETVTFEVVPTVNPAAKSFTVTYVDAKGNVVPGGGKLSFTDIGSFSRKDIPLILPDGYQAFIPANQDEEWHYPTSLEFIDGQWTVTNAAVKIQVEKKASVKVQFVLADGTVLQDDGYEKYYGEVGSFVENITAPDGYKLAGGNHYTIQISRDAEGNLTADRPELTIKVAKPETSRPEIPATGDIAPSFFILLSAAALTGTVMVVMMKKRHKAR